MALCPPARTHARRPARTHARTHTHTHTHTLTAHTYLLTYTRAWHAQMRGVAAVAQERGCCRFQWQAIGNAFSKVLYKVTLFNNYTTSNDVPEFLSDFNEPAIEYYKNKLNARERMETGGAKVLPSFPPPHPPGSLCVTPALPFCYALVKLRAQILMARTMEKERHRGGAGAGGGERGREREKERERERRCTVLKKAHARALAVKALERAFIGSHQQKRCCV